MDQSKLQIPQFARISKACSELYRLRTHLSGVLDHGHQPLAVIDLFQWPHDSNYAINILVYALTRREYLPDILYLQLDNCYRENKNQYMFSFLAILVHLEIFKKV